jgi:hypothetical protein
VVGGQQAHHRCRQGLCVGHIVLPPGDLIDHMRRYFFVPGARAAVLEHVCACEVSQQNKVENLHPAGLLQPLDVPMIIWAHVSMDFMEGVPTCQWEDSHPHYHGSLLQICSFHANEPPLYNDICGQGVLRRNYQAPRYSRVHRE